MAKSFYEKLSKLVKELSLREECLELLEIKHFFNGAALYANQNICASWSPAGLAFKLSVEQVDHLITNGEAKPFKYFAKGHVKKGYALFENPSEREPSHWKQFFLKAITQTQGIKK